MRKVLPYRIAVKLESNDYMYTVYRKLFCALRTVVYILEL